MKVVVTSKVICDDPLLRGVLDFELKELQGYLGESSLEIEYKPEKNPEFIVSEFDKETPNMARVIRDKLGYFSEFVNTVKLK